MPSHDSPVIKRNDSQCGATVVELVVALSILAVLSGVVWVALSNGFRRAEETGDRAQEVASLVMIDFAVRDATARVRPPYWLAEAPISIESGPRVELRYIDGRPDGVILIVSEENATVFEYASEIDGAETTRAVYEGATLLEAAVATDDSGAEIGISLSLAVGDRHVTTVAPFGAVVLESQ